MNTVGASTFASGDIVLITGASDPANNGYREVVSHAAGLLTIDSTPVEGFSGSAFVVDAADTTAALTKVNVAVMRANTSGDWEVAKGSTVPLSYSGITAGLLASNNTWTGTNTFQDEVTTEAVKRQWVTVTGASYSVLGSDHGIYVNNTAAGTTVDLPAATGSGRELIVKRSKGSTQSVAVDPSGAEIIEGNATPVNLNKGGSITLIDIASGQWIII